MKLSFVLPVYNVETYIINCLDSLYDQKMDEDDFEVICINDGSTDNSLALIESYKRKHTNLRIKTISNSGQGKARNIGIKEARGEYIFFVDSDDYIAKNTVENILQIAMKLKIDMLYFDSYVVSDDNSHEPRYLDSNASPVLTGKEYYAKYFPGNGPWLFLIRREFLIERNLSFVEGRLCEDGMFAVLSTNNAKSVAYCHADVYRYALRSNSTVTRKDKDHLAKMVDDFVYAILYINKYIENAIIFGDSQEYIKRLIERRNSYTFFLQVRMLKAGIEREKRNKYLQRLQENRCYPNVGLTPDYGRRNCLLARIFQSYIIYNLMCDVYKILNNEKKNINCSK